MGNLIRQCPAAPAPAIQLSAGPGAASRERLRAELPRRPEQAQPALLPPRPYSTGFTFATNKAVAFFRNSSRLMELPSFLSCSARSMARARPSGPSLEPASR